MPDDFDVLALMRERVAEAEADAERLRNAIAVIEGKQTAKPARRRTRASQEKPATSAKVVRLGRALKAIGDEPGQTTTMLAKTLNGDQAALLALLKEAETEGKVRREGERRATRWYVAAAAG